MELKVFIECEAGVSQKNVFDEETLEHKESFMVSRAYPFPYGFIQKTQSGDGDCLDCFIITNQKLEVGSIVDIEVIGMMEQFETRDGIRKEDHNILAKIKGENAIIDIQTEQKLKDFILHVWDHRIGKKVEVGNFYSKERAIDLINNLKIK